MSEFVHLHLHTQFSLLDGAIRFEPLFKTARSYDMPACAITDHGNMFGVVDFYFAAKSAGIKPILGCEAYIAPRSRTDKERHEDNAYHVVLLALNNEGYHNLMKLISIAHMEGFYYVPRIDKEVLRQYNSGLICLTACLKGQIPQMILKDDENGLATQMDDYLSIFGDRLYLELQDNGMAEQKKVNEGLLRLASQYNVPLVATNDCHYLRKQEARAHELLLCIQTGKKITDTDRLRLSTDEFYVKSPAEMTAAFSAYPEALANTLRIAEMCQVTVQTGVYHFPNFALPGGRSPEEHFAELCIEGFGKKMVNIASSYGEFTDELREKYKARLAYEMDVIRTTGFASYFLIVADFINYAKSEDIPVGPGRGSAAGSLVAFCLDITNVDPIKYDLLFERFLNPERISMPDIDVDFCFEGRERVIEYVTRKYGKDNVAQIITFGTMKSKAAVRDVGRALGLPYANVDQIAKLIPTTLDITIEQALSEEPRLKELYEKDGTVKELINNAMVLERLARHASTHAAGIVISNKPLMEHVPLYRGQNGETVTQYSMKTIEKIGLVKFDLLGLKTLTIIDNVIKMLRADGVELDITSLPLDDLRTYRLLASGNTSGIFQLESRGMRELLTRLKPSQFEDIIALIALYRPGPLGSGMIDDFIKRKHNPSLVKYETELLREALEETYGVIVYQEQIMKIASLLGNFTKSEADALRKAISKKIPEQLESYKEQFKQGCAANNVRPEAAAKIYDVILRFGQYGFNKSHSAAYALVAYQTAYLKAHHFLPFMAAILTNEVNDTDGLIKYITECRENGVTILPPDINESAKVFTIVGDRIRYGLLGIKGVGAAALDSIIGARGEAGGFSSFTHFCSLVDSRKVNKKVVESLVKAGAFDCMGLRRSQLFALMQDKWDRLSKKNGKNSQQMDIFGTTGWTPKEEEIPQAEELDRAEILKGEKEALGFYFSQHPLSAYQDVISRITRLDTASIKETETSDDVTIVGIVNGYKEITTKRGDRMANISLEDTKGIVEAIIFPDLLSKNQPVLKSDKPIVVTGALERTEDGTCRIRAKIITPLQEIQDAQAQVVRVKIDCAQFKKDYLRRLRDIFVTIRGDSRVSFEFLRNGEQRVFHLPDEVRVDAGKAAMIAKHFDGGLDIEVVKG
ncbi:MAG: DNA polymerase III subunit alpha [Syntrophorhabdales bacterium]